MVNKKTIKKILALGFAMGLSATVTASPGVSQETCDRAEDNCLANPGSSWCGFYNRYCW